MLWFHYGLYDDNIMLCFVGELLQHHPYHGFPIMCHADGEHAMTVYGFISRADLELALEQVQDDRQPGGLLTPIHFAPDPPPALANNHYLDLSAAVDKVFCIALRGYVCL
jgi:hypothetical protein